MISELTCWERYENIMFREHISECSAISTCMNLNLCFEIQSTFQLATVQDQIMGCLHGMGCGLVVHSTCRIIVCGSCHLSHSPVNCNLIEEHAY